MGLQDLFTWRGQTAAANIPAVEDEDIVADVDEPPDHRSPLETDFHKSTIPPQSARKESLLTKALLTSPEADGKPEIHVVTDLSRRRSMISNASLASTAELTSDGGLTSPARTNSPSPPYPRTAYTSFAPYSLAAKTPTPSTLLAAMVEPTKPVTSQTANTVSVSPTSKPAVDATPKKRCISFACGAGMKEPVVRLVAPPIPEHTPVPTTDSSKRQCSIKWACGQPNPSERSRKVEVAKQGTPPKPTEVQRRTGSRSPSATRKSPRPTISSRAHRESTSTIRRASHSPAAIRAKPKYIVADEQTLQLSEATRFHEFASEELQEDDWIRKESDNPRERLTINDTLKMENDIRRLGNEVEEEALEDEEDEEEEGEEDQDRHASDEEDDEDEAIDGSDASDGNETDNEAGFADSDEESDGDGEFAFWTPGRNILETQSGEAATYRASAHRTASTSSIDSLNHMSPPNDTTEPEARPRRRRPIKIRPGTPDLPDSTDFVCGTLDEDRPLEDAYVSCMEARKNARHKRTPQDIDPSFPTSDPEDEEDEDDVIESANDSEDHVWLHGKFEDSDESNGRHRSVATRRKSPAPQTRRLRSPPPTRRLHSPPPPKTRLRSPHLQRITLPSVCDLPRLHGLFDHHELHLFTTQPLQPSPLHLSDQDQG